jgi:hypothetical protein
MMAHLCGAAVPRTLVISRRVRPFQFGHPTGSLETWLRTCPIEQNPGCYTTTPHWSDPFELLAREDPEHKYIASVLSQDAVPASYSGAAITQANGRLIVEGTAGSGEHFMVGLAKAQELPKSVLSDVNNANKHLRDHLGPVRFEWVHDGDRLWIVQLHRGKTASTSATIVPGDASEWERFPTVLGLEALRTLLNRLAPGVGLILEGEVGLTSHLADLARKAARPTRIVRRLDTTPQLLLFDEESILPARAHE